MNFLVKGVIFSCPVNLLMCIRHDYLIYFSGVVKLYAKLSRNIHQNSNLRFFPAGFELPNSSALQDKSPKKGSKDKSGLTPLLGLFLEKCLHEVWLAKYYNLAVRWLDLSSSLFGGVCSLLAWIWLFFLWFFLGFDFWWKKAPFAGKTYCLCFVMKHPTSKSKLRIIFRWIISHFEKNHVVESSPGLFHF